MEKDKITSSCEVLVIGGSAGSLEVLLKVLPKLNSILNFTIVVVLHRKNSADSMLSELLAMRTSLKVKEVEDKQPLSQSHVYIAPADYHLLFEKSKVMSLDYSEKVNYSRPSIDVAFESASEIFGPSLVCILLSGANSDGVAGLRAAKENGGRIIVQDPGTAESPFMPEQAILKAKVDLILKPEDMAEFINSL